MAECFGPSGAPWGIIEGFVEKFRVDQRPQRFRLRLREGLSTARCRVAFEMKSVSKGVLIS